MLKITRRGTLQDVRELSAEEDSALRRAFGRFAQPGMRAAGAAVVARYQHAGAGHWILCDCLASGVRPPALVPVLQSFIRRHPDPSWPPHADGCDFAKEPAEQRALTRSFRPATEGPLRLIRRFTEVSEAPLARPPESRCYARPRSALATLLMRLMTSAGLTCLGAGAPLRRVSDQFKAIRQATQSLEIDKRVPLAPFLCTYLPALPELLERIATTAPRRFPTTRPHGILISVVTGMAEGRLIVDPQTHIPVRGRIAVFGERDGNGRDTPAGRAARSPYLAVCLVGRPAEDEPVTVLHAYAHPCVSARQFLLVDSDLERRTLQQLQRLQRWLLERQAIRMSIEKPLFDIGPDDQGDADSVPREPCIPDFILYSEGTFARGARTIVIETMGLADPVYRSRKVIMHGMMSRRLDGAPVLEHDFHRPHDMSQDERDRRMWLAARWAITGSACSAPTVAVPSSVQAAVTTPSL